MTKIRVPYKPAIHKFNRRKTRVVHVGDTPLGGNNPVRIQSMTNTRTSNTDDTVAQCIRIIEAGGNYVRITAPLVSDAELMATIKARLVQKGYHQPLIADIHYSPKAAAIAATHIEKIRINPGNFADKKKFAQLDYSDEEYEKELIRIEKRFAPLIETCKTHQTAMRIGVNHGSLSDRIMSRYGDTPEGMAESAMEYLRICKKYNYLNIVVSMKASNTLIMVQSNRLLASMMDTEGLSFPIHLGVTEAGEGEDGRLKSAIGIGSLLADGIGDTIRVSLTEPPEKEIPVAKKIVDYIDGIKHHRPIPEIKDCPINPFEYTRRITHPVANTGGQQVPVVIASYNPATATNDVLKELGFAWDTQQKIWTETDQSPEYLYTPDLPPTNAILPNKTKWVIPFEQWKKNISANNKTIPLVKASEIYHHTEELSETGAVFISLQMADLTNSFCTRIKKYNNLVAVLETTNENGLAEQRRAFCELIKQECSLPVIIKRRYHLTDKENFQLAAAIDTGPLFLDGLGDGLWIENSQPQSENVTLTTAFGILQASRVRLTKPEFISCPGCGRTLFELEDTLAKIKARTGHLKGLKIGVMGCIVNGIGEMADADYGYVGAGPGKITLYRNKEVIKKNLPEKAAVDELIKVIKENGDWIE